MDRLAFDGPFANEVSSLPVRGHGEAVAQGFVTALWRRRMLLVGCVALGLAAGGAALLVMPGRYASEAIVQLDLSRRDGAYAPSISPSVALEANALMQSEARIARSRAIGRRVVERFDLAAAEQQPAQPGALAALRERLAARLDGVVPTALLAILAPAAEPPPDAAADTANAVTRALGRLSVGADNRSYLLTFGYSAADPVAAARMANGFAEEYLRWRAEANAEAAGRTSEWLATQIEAAAAALRVAEADVAAFRERTGLLSGGAGQGGVEAESVAQQQLRTLTAQLDAAGLARMALVQRQARVQEMLRTGNTPSASDIQGMPLITNLMEREAVARRELGELLTRFGASHPSVVQAQAGIGEMQRRIRAEMQRGVSVIAGEVATAQQAEEELKARVAALQRGMIASQSGETELRNKLAEAQSIRDRLASLRRSYEQALAARDIRPVIAVMVQTAEPDRTPASPKPLIVLAVSLVAGLGLGVVAAALLERRDTGLRTGAEARAHFDLRCLGMVPELDTTGRRGVPQRLQASFDEAIHAAGAGVSLFGRPGESRVVLVTSSVEGEGKSIICRALGKALAASGQRVLIVGGAPIGEPPARPGAASGNLVPMRIEPGATGRSGVQAIVERKVSFSPGTDVFGPGTFGALLADARRHFDVILIEGGPVMLVSDSLVLGRLADSVILVARWSHTPRRVIGAALRRLEEHFVTVDGLVLARVDLRRHAQFRFVDECLFYWREKRFYERLARRHRDRTANDNPIANRSDKVA